MDRRLPANFNPTQGKLSCGDAVQAAIPQGLGTSMVERPATRIHQVLVNAFVKNFQATYKRLVGIKELR
jgi:hypothetical protein